MPLPKPRDFDLTPAQKALVRSAARRIGESPAYILDWLFEPLTKEKFLVNESQSSPIQTRIDTTDHRPKEKVG